MVDPWDAKRPGARTSRPQQRAQCGTTPVFREPADLRALLRPRRARSKALARMRATHACAQRHGVRRPSAAFARTRRKQVNQTSARTIAMRILPPSRWDGEIFAKRFQTLRAGYSPVVPPARALSILNNYSRAAFTNYECPRTLRLSLPAGSEDHPATGSGKISPRQAHRWPASFFAAAARGFFPRCCP